MRMAYTLALNSPALTSDISWNYASNSSGAKLKWNQMSWHILLGRFEDATTTVNCVAVWLDCVAVAVAAALYFIGFHKTRARN